MNNRVIRSTSRFIRRRYKIWPCRLQYNNEKRIPRNSYAICRILQIQMTLSYPSSRFQGHDIIQRHITRKWYSYTMAD